MGLAMLVIIHGSINYYKSGYISNECSSSANSSACESTCPSTRILQSNECLCTNGTFDNGTTDCAPCHSSWFFAKKFLID